MQAGEQDQQRFEVTRMAFEVCRRIEQITPIKSTDVLTMVLLGANRRALTAAEIYQQSIPITELVQQRDLPVATGAHNPLIAPRPPLRPLHPDA